MRLTSPIRALSGTFVLAALAACGSEAKPDRAAPAPAGASNVPAQLTVQEMLAQFEPIAMGERAAIHLGKQERERTVVAGDTTDAVWIRLDDTEPDTSGAERVVRLRMMRYELQCAKRRQRVLAQRTYDRYGTLQGAGAASPPPPFQEFDPKSSSSLILRHACAALYDKKIPANAS